MSSTCWIAVLPRRAADGCRARPRAGRRAAGRSTTVSRRSCWNYRRQRSGSSTRSWRHRARSPRIPSADSCMRVRFEVRDSVNRHRARCHRANLQAFRAGRRFDHAQLRRHRARPRDQQAPGGNDGRRGRCRQHPGRRQHLLAFRLLRGRHRSMRRRYGRARSAVRERPVAGERQRSAGGGGQPDQSGSRNAATPRSGLSGRCRGQWARGRSSGSAAPATI